MAKKKCLRITGLFEGKVYRKPWFSPSNKGVSCSFSHQSIERIPRCGRYSLAASHWSCRSSKKSCSTGWQRAPTARTSDLKEQQQHFGAKWWPFFLPKIDMYLYIYMCTHNLLHTYMLQIESNIQIHTKYQPRKDCWAGSTLWPL